MSGDQRAALTRRLIAEALVRLLVLDPARKVSVSELCREAGVGRSTFYLHYRSVDDVLDDMEAEFAARVSYVNEDKTVNENVEAFAVYLAYCREHADRLRVLRATGRLDRVIARRSLEIDLRTPEHRESAPDSTVHRLLTDYAIAGTYRAVETWVSGKTGLSAHDFAHVILGAALALGLVEDQLPPFDG